MLAGMNRLQFSLLDLLVFLTGFAVYAGILSYVWPRHSFVLFAAPLVAMAIIGSVCLVPGRHGRWVRPIAVFLVCLASFALGLWLQRN
jgi:uncharacterized membrane protein YadS